MKTIACWKLSSINDSGPNGFVARFATREEAEAASPCASGYGHEIEKEIIEIYDSAIEFNPRMNKPAIASGLSKLTDEEKLALGLSNL